MASYGPRAGVGMGRMRYMNSPSAAYENAQEDLMDAEMAYSRGDYGQMMQSLGGAAMQGVRQGAQEKGLAKAERRENCRHLLLPSNRRARQSLPNEAREATLRHLRPYQTA